MTTQRETLGPILMVDDDPDDCDITRRAMAANKVPNPFRTVESGEELMDYVLRRGPYAREEWSLPALILLDLNMPRMDGREALQALKSNDRLKKIPVVVLTTSRSPEDLSACYGWGANSYVAKPQTFEELVQVVAALKDYWLTVVELPSPEDRTPYE